jgi:hypothetical protein
MASTGKSTNRCQTRLPNANAIEEDFENPIHEMLSRRMAGKCIAELRNEVAVDVRQGALSAVVATLTERKRSEKCLEGEEYIFDYRGSSIDSSLSRLLGGEEAETAKK